MCHINLFIKTHKKNHKKLKAIVHLLNCTTTHSFITNDDGDGVYFDSNDLLVKSANKINFINYMNEIKDSHFILSHQRIATHGLSKRYTQPFMNEDFVLLHNGILSHFAKRDYSDTWGFFRQFMKLFEKNKNKKREKNIIYCIKKLLDITSGTYSIALFDKKTEILYYFKNWGTDINFYRSKDKKEVYITTSGYNKDILDLYGKFDEMSFYDNRIYKISIKNDKVLYSVLPDEIEEAKSIYVDTQRTNFYGYNNQNNQFSNPDKDLYANSNREYHANPKNSIFPKVKQDKSKAVLSQHIESSTLKMIKRAGFCVKRLKKCFDCKKYTDLYNEKENKYFCYECIEETYL